MNRILFLQAAFVGSLVVKYALSSSGGPRCARNVQSPPLDRGVNYTFSSLSANQHNYITHTDKVVKYIAPSG